MKKETLQHEECIKAETAIKCCEIISSFFINEKDERVLKMLEAIQEKILKENEPKCIK